MYVRMDSFGCVNVHTSGNDFAILNFIYHKFVCVLILKSSFWINSKDLMMIFSFIIISFSLFIFLRLEMGLMQRYFLKNFSIWKNLMTDNNFLLPSVILKIFHNLSVHYQTMTIKNYFNFFSFGLLSKSYDLWISSKRKDFSNSFNFCHSSRD